MGGPTAFTRNRSIRAIYFSKAVTTVEAAVNWLLEHDTEPDIDEPLLVKKVCGPGELSSQLGPGLLRETGQGMHGTAIDGPAVSEHRGNSQRRDILYNISEPLKPL